MSDDLRDLLGRVAAGTLDPAEAARLLDERSAPASATGDEQEPAAPPVRSATGGVRRVVIRVAYRSVRLVGDRSVATVAIEGEHRLSHDGDAVVVSDAAAPSLQMSQMTQPSAWAALLRQQHRLVVRANPDLAADVEVSAGSLHVEAMPKLSRVRVTAGSARVTSAEEPLDLVVQAGSANVAARPRTGRWTLRAESGSLSLTLLPGSDATVTGHASMGRLSVGPEAAQGAVVGSGTAAVDVEVVMGNATVELPG